MRVDLISSDLFGIFSVRYGMKTKNNTYIFSVTFLKIILINKCIIIYFRYTYSETFVED